MRIVVTGSGGRLGSQLVQTLALRHDVSGIDIDQLDITDYEATQILITDVAPDVIIHAAAWTDVDGCARNPERAIEINGFGAQNIALAAAHVNASILYFSTNEVFYGQLNRPYLEYDTPNPANSYGYSKMVGERAIAAINPRHYIVRTAWLFAHTGTNFIHRMIEAASNGQVLRVVTDEVANPTYCNDLVDAVDDLIETERYGIYHLTNESACSRYTLARYVLDRAGYADVIINPISSREWPRASVPPAYTALTNLAGRLIGISLRPWHEAVDAFLRTEGLYQDER